MNEATILTHSQKSQFIKEYVRFLLQAWETATCMLMSDRRISSKRRKGFDDSMTVAGCHGSKVRSRAENWLFGAPEMPFKLTPLNKHHIVMTIVAQRCCYMPIFLLCKQNNNFSQQKP